MRAAAVAESKPCCTEKHRCAVGCRVWPRGRCAVLVRAARQQGRVSRGGKQQRPAFCGKERAPVRGAVLVRAAGVTRHFAWRQRQLRPAVGSLRRPPRRGGVLVRAARGKGRGPRHQQPVGGAPSRGPESPFCRAKVCVRAAHRGSLGSDEIAVSTARIRKAHCLESPGAAWAVDHGTGCVGWSSGGGSGSSVAVAVGKCFKSCFRGMNLYSDPHHTFRFLHAKTV